MTPVDELERVQQVNADLDAELRRTKAEAAMLRELLCESLGLDLGQLAHLQALHRLGQATSELDPDTLLDALGHRWWPTGLIARGLLPAGGRGLRHDERKAHRDHVVAMLRQLEAAGDVERRRVAEDGRVLGAGESARGRTEWRRTAWW